VISHEQRLFVDGASSRVGRHRHAVAGPSRARDRCASQKYMTDGKFIVVETIFVAPAGEVEAQRDAWPDRW